MKPFSKPFWESKTFWVGFAHFLIAVLLAAIGEAKVQPYLEQYPTVLAWVVGAEGILMIILRIITDQKLLWRKQ